MITYEEHKKKHLNCRGEWLCTIWGIEQGCEYEKARWEKKIEKLKEQITLVIPTNESRAYEKGFRKGLELLGDAKC